MRLLILRKRRIRVKNGRASYNCTREGRNRWGSDSGISGDPTDDSFLVFNRYVETVGSTGDDGDGRWGTLWGRLSGIVFLLNVDFVDSLSIALQCSILRLHQRRPRYQLQILIFVDCLGLIYFARSRGLFGRSLGLCHPTNS
jgi:hypothetical protein